MRYLLQSRLNLLDLIIILVLGQVLATQPVWVFILVLVTCLTLSDKLEKIYVPESRSKS